MVNLRLTCQSKKRVFQSKNKEGKSFFQHEITFYLGYSSDPSNPNYPWSQLSGGTAMTLVTINEDAAAKFVEGENYPLEFGEAIL